MKSNRLYLLALSLLFAFLCVSLGCEGGAKFVNSLPSALRLTASRCFVETGGTIRLIGQAHDDDGDSLTFFWKAGTGSFTPPSARGDTVYWKAPAQPGAVTITMTVSDDVGESSIGQGITVCTPFPSPVLASRTIENTGSVYILLDENGIRIPGNVTLTIEPGVTIVVDKGSGGFEVYGRFVAVGTPLNRIRIQGNSCTSASGLWGGIYLNEKEARGILENVDITMGMDGVQVSDSAQLSIDDCEIYNNSDMGISVLHLGSEAQIRSCLIWENGTGLYVSNATADVRSSSIRYNDGNGIEIDFSTDVMPVAIDSCSIANNGISGIQLAEQAVAEIHYCSIFSNGENGGEPNYGLKLASYYASDSVHAEHNYWGLGNTTEAKISAVIYDRRDNPSQISAYVGFAPWLDTGPVMMASSNGRDAKGRAWARLWR
jgi:hypothetical protein